MKKAWAVVLLGAVAALWVACGGSSTPSAPSSGGTSTSQTMTVVSGDTGAPVGGIRVVAAGTSYTTNASGQVSIPAALATDTTVDLEGTNSLKRETTLGSGPQFSLWPTEARGGTEAWTRQVLHGTFGTSSILRPDPQFRQYTIIPTAALAADAAAIAALERQGQCGIQRQGAQASP